MNYQFLPKIALEKAIYPVYREPTEPPSIWTGKCVNLRGSIPCRSDLFALATSKFTGKICSEFSKLVSVKYLICELRCKLELFKTLELVATAYSKRRIFYVRHLDLDFEALLQDVLLRLMFGGSDCYKTAFYILIVISL